MSALPHHPPIPGFRRWSWKTLGGFWESNVATEIQIPFIKMYKTEPIRGEKSSKYYKGRAKSVD